MHGIRFLYDKEAEINLQVLEDEDYASTFVAANTEDVRQWLGADEATII